jgi:cell division protein FtsB
MDKQFLEFWGNIMLNAAKGQQQLDDIMKWFSGNSSEFTDITSLFCKMYGIDPEAQKSPGYLNVWQKAIEEFQRSFGELAIMMDLVPRKEYVALSRENQELKKRIAELEEGNAHLRTLLAEKVSVPHEGIKGFQELINEQARQYQDFMKSVTTVFETPPKAAAAQPKAPEPTKAKPKPAAKAPAKKTAHSSAKTGK